jgi:hypothetical protein
MKVILSVPDEGYSERTWWRLFWAYLMKVILSVPDEGYSERTWWRLFWAYMMKVILSVPDEGYSESTRWRLFWAYLMKVILSIPDESYSERIWWRLFCAYLMKVILSVPDEGYSRNASRALNLISSLFIFFTMIYTLWKESLINHFHQYQQNEQSPLVLTNWIQNDHVIWHCKSRSWLGTDIHMWRS